MHYWTSDYIICHVEENFSLCYKVKEIYKLSGSSLGWWTD